MEFFIILVRGTQLRGDPLAGVDPFTLSLEDLVLPPSLSVGVLDRSQAPRLSPGILTQRKTLRQRFKSKQCTGEVIPENLGGKPELETGREKKQ